MLDVLVLTASLLTAVPEAPFELLAVKTAAPPAIDGRVTDDEWAGAARAGSFIQFEPRRGEPSPFRTEVLALYDAGHLYVAFRNWDADAPTAQLTQRDADLFNDDSVGLLLDSYYDRQTAYYFMTNPLGTQSDGRIGDNGRSTDAKWDAPWRSAAQPTDYGWSAEIAIPFASIKYAAGTGRTWGINFVRSRRRSLELSFWTGPLDSRTRVSQAGTLTGLDVPPPPRRHQIIPYGLSRVQQSQAGDWEAGLDVRYAVTPQMSAYATVNPDFATIEADQEQVNLTRYEISLPEKRQFFLEGQELFGQRIRTFYSRRISDITFGGKVLGKTGPWTLATLTTQSDPIGALPDSPTANYTVFRAQPDLPGSSNVAVMVANRAFDGRHEGSIGLDTNLFFTKTFGMTGQLVKSYGRYHDGTMGFFVRPSYDSATGHFHVRYTHLGERFGDQVNAIGFIRDDDRRELDSAIEKTVWIRSGAFERLEYGSNYNIFWGQTGVLRGWAIDQSAEVEFRNRWSADVSLNEEFRRFEKDFRNRETELTIGYNTREYQSVRFGYAFGRSFDAGFGLWTAGVRRKLTPELSTEYALERLVLDPDPEDESTWIHVIRANQFFTKDLFVRLFFQTNSSIDRRNLQMVFVYRYLPPFGTLQLAYQRGTAAFGQRSEQGHTLFLKATTVF
jgi:hypothetical protein